MYVHMNGPYRCDEFQESLPMCRSVCENFFRVCGYDSKLWQCDAVQRGANELFPGQPFKRNEFVAKTNDELGVCTPSIKNDGIRTRVIMSSISILISIYMHLV